MRLLSFARVRSAGPDDAEQLAALCQAHAEFERLDFDAHGFAQRLAAALSCGALHAWLALDGAQAVGYATASPVFSTLQAAHYMHMDCLYLMPEFRGQGLGGVLMQAVRDHAQAQGCQQLQWQTPDWNHGAIDFYHRAGALGLPKQRFSLALPDDEDKS
ncbi:Acetyltransferase (GNAT) family protein [Rhodoferax sp. OV413]|uniref:GNAT family N-acetyltransferase n=1 Tax=Rhodoferax sp. OV413 TaxID=1855285 RepID=UPI0008861D75|nr:GNAT family N-acetyltransferase [Rhodoferax sp. OV413]SDP88754.1 Acetyltransferase (GNAT) family protein [Rhodoferax sp. OV413]